MNRAERRRRQKLERKAQKKIIKNVPGAMREALGHHQAGRFRDAQRIYGQILQIEPDHAEALHLSGVLSSQMGDHEAGAELIGRTIGVRPDYAEAHHNLGNVLFQQDRREEAIASVARAIELDPDYGEAYFNLGQLLRQEGRVTEATTSFRRAAELEPDDAAVHASLGHLLLEQGHVDDAAACYRRALALDPSDAQVHRQLARASAGAPGESDVTAMESLFETAGLGPEDRIELGFGLAEVYEAASDYDAAFERLADANALARASIDYDIAHDEAAADEIISACDADFSKQHAKAGYESEIPIFVFGMPRSGTSLVEQIISSHPDVFGAGEVNLLRPALFADFPRADGQSLSAFIAALTNDDLTQAGAAYDARLSALAPEQRFITDKYLNNFWYVGLIGSMLPKARLVHCVRDPMDTCFSCYANLFSGEGRFAYELGELGRYYRIYDRLMGHWRDRLGDRLVEIRYEDLVGEPDVRIRDLIGALGLNWDEGCLRFFETERFVGTASSAQVRRPIYHSTVGRWRHFADRLDPLIEALGGLGSGGEP